MYIAGDNRPVDTGNTYFNELNTSLARQTLRARESLKEKPISDNPPLKARINHGRWITDCPSCNNVEFAFEDGLFFCSECRAEIRRVDFPNERKQIETLLAKRLIINRHWNLGDTIDDLVAENKGIKEA